MGFFKKIVGFLGFGKEDDNANPNANDNNNTENYDNNSDETRRNRMNVDPVHVGPRRGFSVPVQVPVDRPVVGPILAPCNGDGGLQGFRWYAESLRVDEDGDVADEFIHEVSHDLSHHSNVIMHDHSNPIPRFEVKTYERRPRIIEQKVTPKGECQHLVLVSRGRRLWV